MKTVLVLVTCVLGLQLGACMRTVEPMRSVNVPARLTSSSASLPASNLILGVN